MGKGKQLSINLITQIISFGLNLGISFFLTPYIIEFIGKEVYGFVSLANNFTSYISVFTVALNGILSRYVTIAYSRKEYKSASRYLSSVFITNIITMVILLPISIMFVVNLGKYINLPYAFDADIKILFILVFITFLINLPGCCYNTATYATNRLDKSNICNMWGSIMRIAVIIGLLLMLKPHVWYVGLGAFVSTVFIIIKNIRYKKQLMPQVEITYKNFDITAVKELLCVGIWNTINQMTQLLMTGLDLVIANLFISVLSMNLLSYAKMIPTQMVSLIAMISGLFAPLMTIAYASGDMKNFVRETNFAIKLCGFLCSVPTIGIVVFGEEFFELWLHALSSEEVHTVAILSILTILPQIFSVYIYPLYTVNTVTTKLKVPVLVSAVIGVLNIIIVYILVKTTSWEIYAVAGVSSVLALLRIFVFVPLYAANSIKVPYITFYKPLLRGIASNVVMILIFYIIKRMFDINGWGTFMIVCVIAGIIGYITTFIILFNREEKKKVLSKLCKRGV